MEQKITLESKDGLVKVVIEGGPKISKEEKERMQREWEKPENQAELERLLKIYGEYKRVVDQKTGITFKVPTRDIITKGISYEDLPKYPRLED
jgi:hypothetical protein